MTWKNPGWIAYKFVLADWGPIWEKGQQHSGVSTHSETLPKVQKGLYTLTTTPSAQNSYFVSFILLQN